MYIGRYVEVCKRLNVRVSRLHSANDQIRSRTLQIDLGKREPL